MIVEQHTGIGCERRALHQPATARNGISGNFDHKYMRPGGGIDGNFRFRQRRLRLALRTNGKKRKKANKSTKKAHDHTVLTMTPTSIGVAA